LGRLFGTDGVRGVTNVDLTPELALKLGLAIGTRFGQGARILVGRDARAGGDMIMSAVVAGLLSSGSRVYIAGSSGFAPTPAIQVAVRELGYDAGVIVTASHNPPEFNGVKVVGPLGAEIPREVEREIEEIFYESRFRRASWRDILRDVQREERVLETYIKSVLSHVDKQAVRRRSYRVLVDCANSVSALTVPQILREMGVKVYTLACNLDLIPYREPEPTPSSLREAAAAAKALGVDLGVGHDGDGDRAILIDERGVVHWGDRMGALLSAYVAENKLKDAKRRVYTAVSSSKVVEDYLRSYGIEVVWTPVGAVNMSYRLLREGGVAAFEENGGFIYPPHLLARDGGITIALFLEMMAVEGAKASELFARLPEMHTVKLKVPMPRDVARAVTEKLAAKYQAAEGVRVTTVDGVRVDGEDYWFLVRPSGTEPVLRIMVEARSLERAKQIAEELTQQARRLAES
jgi:phosphomannomutase/phosphoglucomutase